MLVMPALSFEYDAGGTTESFKAGTVIRIPVVFEWEFLLTDRFSIVPGIIPSPLILLRGSQAKSRPVTNLCFLGKCESESVGTGVAVEGQLGMMWWIGSQALRVDIRLGYESLETVSAALQLATETLTGARMTWFLAFEI